MSAFFMLIGLTGNIATGKSTIYKLLCEYENVQGFDADKVVDSLYSNPDVITELVEELGESIINNESISRVKVRELFLSDSQVRNILEKIFHPRVYKEYLNLFHSLPKGHHLLADIPLLFEKETPYDFDKIITIACSDKIQLSRLMLRSSLDKETALAMIKKQVALSEKMRQSDIVLWNNGNLDHLQRQINLLVEQIF